MSSAPFTFRQGLPRDTAAWLELLPHEMPIDPAVAAALPQLWRTLLGDDAVEARTIVSGSPGHERVDAFGLSVFLRPGLFEDLVARPPRRLAETLYRALLAGERPLLRGREIAKANAGDGVDVCVLHFCERPVDLTDPIGQQLLAMGHAAFRDAHLGHNLRALLHQNFRPAHKAFQLAGGMALLHEDAPGAADWSFLVGMTRAQSLEQPAGSPISFLFRAERPRFYFSPAERRVLKGALSGGTDTDIATHLGVSRDAVKAAWKSIFRRVETGTPHTAARASTATQRRRQLLGYLRQHPEELRPYARVSPRAVD